MGNYKRGTDNTIGGSNGEVFGSNECWIDVDKMIHFGRKIDLEQAGLSEGDVLPAGSMVHYDNESDYAEVIKGDAPSAKLKTVNGLTRHDVRVPSNCTFASVGIVVAGKLYGDATDVPASVEAQLPMIVFERLRKDAKEAFGIED
jgi:hypothetical protein